VGNPPTLVGGYHGNTAGNFGGVAIAGGGTSGSINQVAGDYAFIGAGHGGYAGPFAAVVGGAGNTSLGPFSFIGTGRANTNLGPYAAILGGTNNTITALADNAFIGGGQNNIANNTHATVGGGEANRAANWATVGGGSGNQGDGAFATVSGGLLNTSGGWYSAVPGGDHNSAGGHWSFAAGRQAKANHQGSFVWADSQAADFASTTSDQFSLRASGGLRLAPETSAYFGQRTRQMLNLWSTNYGIGVQSLTTYFRTDSADGGGGFAWYQGGMHSDVAQDAGGGQTLMRLTGDGLVLRGSNNRVLMSVLSNGLGVVGLGTGNAIYAQNIGPAIAVSAFNPDPNGWAGSFDGRVFMNGKVGIGTAQPSARLSVVAPGASELAGSARSATLLTSAGALGTSAGDELALATIGFNSGNNSSLGIRAKRVANGSAWPSTAIGLGMDVDNTTGAGASLWLHANGNVGLGTTTPATSLEIRGDTSAGPSLRLTGIGGFGSKVGIDLATYDPGALGVSSVAARIEASDDNWSAGIDFQTKEPGNDGNNPLASRLFIQNDGNVGIGTTTPASQLDVVGGASGNAIQGTTGNGSASGVYGENNGHGFGVAGRTTGVGIAVYGDNIDPAGWAGYFDGKVSTCSLQIRGGCDLAEPFQMSDKDLPKGAVVVIDDTNPGHLRLSESAYDTRVAGIISGANGVNPGISLHQEGVMEGGQNVALSGRVYVQADASNGAIKPGDLLTTSATPGRAMKVADHGKAQGAIIGKAMSPLKEGKGMVLVLVTLQ
jgi:hypothetical protein